MLRLRIFFLLAVAFCKPAVASLEIVDAELSVVIPYQENLKINVSMADFGIPKYGGFLRGELVYVSTQRPVYNNRTYKCFPRDCEYGCDLDKITPNLSLPKLPGTSYIMMIDRGPRDVPDQDACFFLDKVYNAQLVGADAVLVANDRDEEVTTMIAADSQDALAEVRSLSVSAGMISKRDADRLRGLLASNGGAVELVLSWTAALPKASQVSWELWMSSEDVCYHPCGDTVNFIRNAQDELIKFEQSGLTKFTPRYFLAACKPGTNNDSYCLDNCFSNGRYCEYPTVNNYTGKDILRMNLLAKCFFLQASNASLGYLWWEYAARVNVECSVTKRQYNAECAAKVFDSLASSHPIGSRGTWQACAVVNEAAEQIPLLEDDLMWQFGNTTKPPMAEAKISPTVRINGEQYRGSLQSGPVLRALCAAFPTGHEPAVCNSGWVSDDECRPPYGEGYVKCKVAESGNRTRCVNTFGGYQCTCGGGFQLVFQPGDAYSEICDDINECLISTAPLRNPMCSCARCACKNTVGSYECTGELRNLCTPKDNFGGCWNAKFGDQHFSSCVDDVQDYQSRAARGLLKPGDSWAKCGECPKCFRPTADGRGCEPRCDLSQCDQYTGYCKDDSGKAAGGGGGGKSQGSSGVHPGFLVLVALGTAALTGAVVMAANHIIMRRRMGEEIREIMGSYMPLQEDRARASAGRRGGGAGGDYRERIIRPDEDSDEEGGVGPYGWASDRPAVPAATDAVVGAAAPPTLVAASQRAVWGPAPVPAAAAAAAEAAPKPAAVAKPTVDAFPGGGAAEEEPLRPAAPAANADPLLGMALTRSSSSLEAPAPSRAGGQTKPNAGGVDNPFL